VQPPPARPAGPRYTAHMNTESIRGRGAAEDPPNRFVPIEIVREEWTDECDPGPKTQFLRDTSRSVIAYNQSPDVGFEASVNPYRGCEHGCVYCYARPFHEYLGFSAGLDFETRIMVKEDAPALLRRELMARGWKPQTLALSGVTDPYQPVEKRLRLTRGCLEALAEFRNPVCVITKNELVTRDVDLLDELASYDAAVVNVSITTLDAGLHRVLEPRTSSPARRLVAVRELSERGIPTGVLIAPSIPGLTDHEIPRIVEAAAEAGACTAGYVALRLPGAVAPLFESWLERHFPDRKTKVLNRVRDMHGGRLYDSEFGRRMRGSGTWAEQMRYLFDAAFKRAGLRGFPTLTAEHFRKRGAATPPSLFDPIGS